MEGNDKVHQTSSEKLDINPVGKDVLLGSTVVENEEAVSAAENAENNMANKEKLNQTSKEKPLDMSSIKSSVAREDEQIGSTFVEEERETSAADKKTCMPDRKQNDVDEQLIEPFLPQNGTRERNVHASRSDQHPFSSPTVFNENELAENTESKTLTTSDPTTLVNEHMSGSRDEDTDCCSYSGAVIAEDDSLILTSENSRIICKEELQLDEDCISLKGNEKTKQHLTETVPASAQSDRPPSIKTEFIGKDEGVVVPDDNKPLNEFSPKSKDSAESISTAKDMSLESMPKHAYAIDGNKEKELDDYHSNNGENSLRKMLVLSTSHTIAQEEDLNDNIVEINSSTIYFKREFYTRDLKEKCFVYSRHELYIRLTANGKLLSVFARVINLKITYFNTMLYRHLSSKFIYINTERNTLYWAAFIIEVVNNGVSLEQLVTYFQHNHNVELELPMPALLPEEEQPGNQQDADPGNQQDAYPGNLQDAAPGNEQDAAPGNQQDAYPGNQQDAYPGNQQNAAPDNQQNADPGNQQDAAPGNQQDAAPGNQQDAAPENDDQNVSGDWVIV